MPWSTCTLEHDPEERTVKQACAPKPKCARKTSRMSRLMHMLKVLKARQGNQGECTKEPGTCTPKNQSCAHAQKPGVHAPRNQGHARPIPRRACPVPRRPCLHFALRVLCYAWGVYCNCSEIVPTFNLRLQRNLRNNYVPTLYKKISLKRGDKLQGETKKYPEKGLGRTKRKSLES